MIFEIERLGSNSFFEYRKLALVNEYFTIGNITLQFNAFLIYLDLMIHKTL